MPDTGVFMHNIQNPAFQTYLEILRKLREKYTYVDNDDPKHKVPGEDDYIFKDGRSVNQYVQELKECGIVDARKDLELSDLLNLNTNRFGGDRCKKDYECSSNKCIGTNLLRTKWGICKKAEDDKKVFDELKEQNFHPPDISDKCKKVTLVTPTAQTEIAHQVLAEGEKSGAYGVPVASEPSPVQGGGYKRRKHRTRKQKKSKKKSRYHRKSRRGKRRKTSKKTKHNRRRKNKSVRRR